MCHSPARKNTPTNGIPPPFLGSPYPSAIFPSSPFLGFLVRSIPQSIKKGGLQTMWNLNFLQNLTPSRQPNIYQPLLLRRGPTRRSSKHNTPYTMRKYQLQNLFLCNKKTINQILYNNRKWEKSFCFSYFS